MPFAKLAKSPANTPAGPRLSTQQSFDALELEEQPQADTGTRLRQATQFGHSLASLQPIQRQATPEEDEELQMKPQLQQETMPEEDDELQMKPQLQRGAMPEEEKELQELPAKPQLQREAMPEEEELQAKAIQPKLTIGQPGDKYEQEADSMAAKVMTMPDSAVQREAMPEEDEELQAKFQLQRQSMPEEDDELPMKPQLQRETMPEEDDETLQTKLDHPQSPIPNPQSKIQAKGTAPSVPANFDRQLAQHKGSGQPLPDETRAFMEPRFGADFSNVRVHETPDLANAIQAQAFTHGQDIYFNSGKYNPGSSGGKELLAHELTHVVQQNTSHGLVNRQCGSNMSCPEGTTNDWTGMRHPDYPASVAVPVEHSTSAAQEWTPSTRRDPKSGETLQGYPIEKTRRGFWVRTPNRRYKLVKRRTTWGLRYGGSGTSDSIDAAIREIAHRYRQRGQEYRAQAAEGFSLVSGHEGGLSAINTYDNQVFTLGSGFAGGRLNRMLNALSGTSAGDRLSQISYFSNLSFDKSQTQIRLDVNAIENIVDIVESDEFVNSIAEAQIREFIRGSALGGNSNESLGNNLGARSEVIGVAAYLRHGRPAFTPDPIRDVQRAISIAGNNTSAQVAVLLKLHAQRIFLSQEYGPESGNAAAAVSRRLPNKIPIFERKMREQDPSFSYDYAAARSIIPCIRSGRWHSSSTEPGEVVYLASENRFYNFGSQI